MGKSFPELSGILPVYLVCPPLFVHFVGPPLFVRFVYPPLFVHFVPSCWYVLFAPLVCVLHLSPPPPVPVFHWSSLKPLPIKSRYFPACRSQSHCIVDSGWVWMPTYRNCVVIFQFMVQPPYMPPFPFVWTVETKFSMLLIGQEEDILAGSLT